MTFSFLDEEKAVYIQFVLTLENVSTLSHRTLVSTLGLSEKGGLDKNLMEYQAWRIATGSLKFNCWLVLQ